MRASSFAAPRLLFGLARAHGDAAYIDQLSSEPSGDEEHRYGERRQPDESRRRRRLQAEPEVDHVEDDDGKIDGHVHDRGLPRLGGQREEIDEARDCGEKRTDDASTHRIYRYDAPFERAVPENEEEVAHE